MEYDTHYNDNTHLDAGETRRPTKQFVVVAGGVLSLSMMMLSLFGVESVGRQRRRRLALVCRLPEPQRRETGDAAPQNASSARRRRRRLVVAPGSSRVRRRSIEAAFQLPKQADVTRVLLGGGPDPASSSCRRRRRAKVPDERQRHGGRVLGDGPREAVGVRRHLAEDVDDSRRQTQLPVVATVSGDVVVDVIADHGDYGSAV